MGAEIGGQELIRLELNQNIKFLHLATSSPNWQGGSPQSLAPVSANRPNPSETCLPPITSQLPTNPPQLFVSSTCIQIRLRPASHLSVPNCLPPARTMSEQGGSTLVYLVITIHISGKTVQISVRAKCVKDPHWRVSYLKSFPLGWILQQTDLNFHKTCSLSSQHRFSQISSNITKFGQILQNITPCYGYHCFQQNIFRHYPNLGHAGWSVIVKA